MSPNELAALCVNRWVSSDHMCWLVRALNKKNPKMSYAKNIPSNFSFAINVGKDQRGNTYFGTFGRPGNHWSMCYLNISEKKAIYTACQNYMQIDIFALTLTVFNKNSPNLARYMAILTHAQI